jgi:hypothetical protein
MFSLEHILAATPPSALEAMYERKPPNSPTRHHLPPTSPPLNPPITFSIDTTYFRQSPVPNHG